MERIICKKNRQAYGTKNRVYGQGTNTMGWNGVNEKVDRTDGNKSRVSKIILAVSRIKSRIQSDSIDQQFLGQYLEWSKQV